MRSIFFAVALMSALQTFAQERNHYLGLKQNLRGGRFQPGIIYQYQFSPKYRLNAELAFNGLRSADFYSLYGSMNLDLQRVWRAKRGFNFFLGVGINYGKGYYTDQQITNHYQLLSFGPQLGVEYDFMKYNVPLVLGLTSRLHYQYQLGTNIHGRWTTPFGVNLRYKF